jgi:hypothetical protein
MSTTLAFRTPPGGVEVGSKNQQIGIVDVSPFERIRVVAIQPQPAGGAVPPISVRLTITEGSELLTQLDLLQLREGSQVTNVYEVPGGCPENCVNVLRQ